MASKEFHIEMAIERGEKAMEKDNFPNKDQAIGYYESVIESMVRQLRKAD